MANHVEIYQTSVWYGSSQFSHAILSEKLVYCKHFRIITVWLFILEKKHAYGDKSEDPDQAAVICTAMTSCR